MMDVNGMMDRCIDAMNSMMGGGMMGKILIFWDIRRLSNPHP